MNPAEHKGKRPRPDCTADRCWCKFLRFHIQRSNAKLAPPKTPTILGERSR